MKLKWSIWLLLIGVWIHAQQKFTSQELAVNEWIDGSLYVPEKPSEHLVILIAGSGPTDRNGNQAMLTNNSLKFLAEALAENGISVYAFDKKFLKQMQSPDFQEENLNFDELVSDVVEITQFFKQKNAKQKIYLAGHSEGSLIGILVANKIKVDGLISIAGMGRSFDEILDEQIGKQAPMLAEENQRVLSELKAGRAVDDVHPMLASLYRMEVQPYMISLMKYNPQEEIKKLNAPILIVQGDNDIQISIEDAELLKSAQPKAELVKIEKMNHIFKIIAGDLNENYASYNNPDLPISDELVQSIVEFVHK